MLHLFKTSFATCLLALTYGLSGCADASSAEQAPAEQISAQTALVSTAPQWDIQDAASFIRFTANQEGEPFTGSFTTFSGRIQFDPEAPETGVVDIVIPLSGVDAGSKDRNSTLPAKIWFSAKAFPEARFTSDFISKTETGYLAKGDLTLKGKSLPIDLPFDLEIKDGQAVMTGKAELDRTLWNVGAEPWNTDEWVSKQVTLDIKVTATASK